MKKSHKLINSSILFNSRAVFAKGPLPVVALSSLLTSMAISSVNILLPELIDVFDISFANTQWVLISYMLSLSASLIIAGSYSDRWGRKKLFLRAVFVFTCAATGCALATQWWMLVVFRALQGIGAALLITVGLALLADSYSKEQLLSAIGMTASMSAIGTGVGPVIGGILLEQVNWQGAFFLNLPLGVWLYLVAMQQLPEDLSTQRQRINGTELLGCGLLILCITCYVLGLTALDRDSLLLPLLMFVLCMLFGWLFIRLENADSAPLLKLSLLKNEALGIRLVSHFIVSITVMGSLVIAPFYLILGLQLTNTQAGLAMIVSPLSVALTASMVAKFAMQASLQTLVTKGIFLLLLGTISLQVVAIDHGLASYLACLIMMAIGYALFLSANSSLIMGHGSEQTRGAIAGLLSLARSLGLLTGAAAIGSLFGYFSQLTHSSTLSASLLESALHQCYRVTGFMLLCALLLQLRLQAKN